MKLQTKKDIIGTLLLLFILLPTTGCGNSDSESADTSSPEVVSESAEMPTRQPNTSPEPIKPSQENAFNKETTPMEPTTQENRTVIVLKTNQGDITIELFNDLSPNTVENFIKLAGDNFYDGTRYHRVIKDFMIQGGDPNSKDTALMARWGTGDPGYKFDDEFNHEPLVEGSLAMANSGPNTNGSQFFIVTAASTPWLDGKHTNFGNVIQGLEVVKKIESTKTGLQDVPAEDAIIHAVEIK